MWPCTNTAQHSCTVYEGVAKKWDKTLSKSRNKQQKQEHQSGAIMDSAPGKGSFITSVKASSQMRAMFSKGMSLQGTKGTRMNASWFHCDILWIEWKLVWKSAHSADWKCGLSEPKSLITRSVDEHGFSETICAERALLVVLTDNKVRYWIALHNYISVPVFIEGIVSPFGKLSYFLFWQETDENTTLCPTYEAQVSLARHEEWKQGGKARQEMHEKYKYVSKCGD